MSDIAAAMGRSGSCHLMGDYPSPMRPVKFAVAENLHPSTLPRSEIEHRRGGRVVYRGGLENRWAARSRGFESLPLRHCAHAQWQDSRSETGAKRRGRIWANRAAVWAQPEPSESIPPSPPSFARRASDGTAIFSESIALRWRSKRSSEAGLHSGLPRIYTRNGRIPAQTVHRQPRRRQALQPR